MVRTIILLCFLLVICFLCYGQDSLTFYADNFLNETDSAKAILNRSVWFIDGKCKVTDKTKDGAIFHQGECTPENPWILEGFSQFYGKTGELYAGGQFSENEMTGQWIYYYPGLPPDTVQYELTRSFESIEDCKALRKAGNTRMTIKTRRAIINEVTSFLNENVCIPPRSGIIQEIYWYEKPRIKFVMDIDGRLKCVQISNAIDADFEKELHRALNQFIYDSIPNKPKLFDFTYIISEHGSEKYGDVYLAVDEVPIFEKPGNALFNRFLHEHTVYPPTEQRITGSVLVTFIIELDGSVSNVKITEPLGPAFDMEAFRVVSSSPPWKPGKHRGIPVRVRMNTEVFFNGRKARKRG